MADIDRNLSMLMAEYDKLPRRYREALELRKMHGYSVAQISTQLGVSEEEVKKRLVKAVGLIKRALSRIENGDSRHRDFSSLAVRDQGRWFLRAVDMAINSMAGRN